MSIRVTFQDIHDGGSYWNEDIEVMPREGDTIFFGSAPKGVSHRVLKVVHHLDLSEHRAVVDVERVDPAFNCLTERQARWHFRHLVLSGIWMLARLIVSKKYAGDTTYTWRNDALTYCDDQGRQGAVAAEYRREKTYPVIKNGDGE